MFLRTGHVIPSVNDGAGQEGGRRPGTANVPYVVGLGHACRIARERLAEAGRRIAALKELLWQQLAAGVPGLRHLGGACTLPNTRSVLFPHMVGNDLLDAIPTIAASTGSACHAGSPKPSVIVLALGCGSDAGQVEAVATALISEYGRVRSP